MNAAFIKSTGRFLGKLSLWSGLFLCPLAVMGQILTTYISPATVSGNPPQVNATNFYNAGTWNIGTLSPYETCYTLNYTNLGSMTGEVGWEFDWGAAVVGPRSWSANFINKSGGTITAVDYGLPNPLTAPNNTLMSFLWVSATNINNKGTLTAGANGEIVLTGSSVNLSRSQLAIANIVPAGSVNGVNTNYFSPDLYIPDQYWGTNNNLYPGTIWDGTNELGGTFYNVGEPCGNTANITFPAFVPTLVNSVSNNSGLLMLTVTNYMQVGPANFILMTPPQVVPLATNQYRQAVFVRFGNAISGQIRFVPSNNPTNLFETVAVQLSSAIPDVITGNLQNNSIYVVDTLAANPFLDLLINYNPDNAAGCSGNTLRPTNYTVARTDPGAFGLGSTNVVVPPANFFFDAYEQLTDGYGSFLEFTNVNITGGWQTIYSAKIDNQSAEVQSGVSVTNLAGRIRIQSDNLDLTQTKVSASGQMVIQTTNLIGAVNSALDCQNFSFNLATTNGSLNFTNLAVPLVGRFHGSIDMWTGLWTNYAMVVSTNYTLTTNSDGSSSLTNAFLTNVLTINLSVLVVDASKLTNTVPVVVQNLALHSPNIIVSDSVTVSNSLLLDGQSATLLGNVTLYGELQDWTYALAPTLLYFTNNGILTIPGDAHFGDDRPISYLAFVNTGSILAAGQAIDSYYFENDGILSASEGFVVTASTGKFQNGQIDAGTAIQFFANNLTFNQSSLQVSSGELDFTVTNMLADAGAGSGNLFTCYDGLNLWIKPRTGDLLGTTITNIASRDNEQIDNAWAGQDRGANTAGFNNNVAIGTLALSAQNPNLNNRLYEPLFHFYGTSVTGTNGMYVHTLDLSQLTANSADVTNMIKIDPNLKIYFSQVLLGFTLPPGTSPEAFLQQQFQSLGEGYFVYLPGTNSPASITINLQTNLSPISPLIYGVAFATSNQLADLNFTLNRCGGELETRYNWQINAHNHGSDWYFESIQDYPANSGAYADDKIANSKYGGAQAMMTIPMIGWMPKLGPGGSKLWSYSITNYGLQTDNDSHNYPYNVLDAGNGISTTNDTPITWNHPTDANFLTNALFQQGFVKHLTNSWGTSTNHFYCMDNEYSLWYSIHRDVHPVGPTMAEIRTNLFAYASMVKSNDPNALICGPEEWGWLGYLYSGFDQQWASSNNYIYPPADYPDRNANGGMDYIPYLLKQLNNYSVTNSTHRRLLDYVTVHCYPQEGSVSSQSATDPATELLRNQTTRVFWDTNYVDPSWINNAIALIPRMKSWVTNYYPYTKIGITEYNWGAEPYINGAIAQADILGIFGREGLDLATRWTTPATNTPTYLAMKMFRNYDGNKSTFGDTNILVALTNNPDVLSVFGAVRTSDGAITLMVINKDLDSVAPIAVNVPDTFNAAGTVQRWQLTDANVITNLTDIPLLSGVVSDIVPPRSVTLYVVPNASHFVLQVGSLQVTLTPANAVSAGAQWQVDGGTWQNSGAIVPNLSVGTHILAFSSANGWFSPASESVLIPTNQVNAVSASYSPAGSLQVVISPVGAVSAGAMWQVDDGTLQNSGSTVSNLSVGNHTVTFSDLSGWITPASQSVAVVSNQTTTTTGTYVQTGSLQVMINPPGAVTRGAMWQVDGGAFQSSGAIVSDLSAGSHTVAFNAISGWATPASQSVSVTAGFTNLAAGFYLSTIDTVKPTVAITAPSANQSVSNTQFMVTGTATDNVAVASVFYMLNSAPWTNATTANKWTNWSAAITLIPGTNTIAAYALDTGGNVSTTSKVSFVCVLSAPLSVGTNGLGSLSTNYNGVLLQIGKSFSITATAAKGFVFTNWTGGTNLPLSIITNKATIQFLMQSNLMLLANFADVTRPTNTITTPISGQHMTNALALVTGKASDNWKVTSVSYQLNNGPWSQPATTNGWTNWTTTVQLIAGTNTIKAYALDLGGNFSITNSVSFVSSNAFKLQLNFATQQPLASNGLNFSLLISSNLNGHIQASTDLLSWLTLTNFVGTNTMLKFHDSTATNFNHRFYRAVIP